VLKSRGMPHSNELCEFELTDHGLTMAAAPGGPGRTPGDAYAPQQGHVRDAAL
jgi:hypothetical protein